MDKKDDQKYIAKSEKQECKDTFCLTCGKKNCAKVDWCPRVDLEV